MGSLLVYERTAGSFHSMGWHMVWCPRYREKVLVGAVMERLVVLLTAEAAERGWTIEALEVMPDHVHAFVRTPPSASAACIANPFKGLTSRRLRQEFPHLRRIPTLWSKSYFVATVSEMTIRRYIDEQTNRPTAGKP